MAVPSGQKCDFGIIVRMYFAPGEHPPPHFHAYYAEHKAIVDIRTCEVLQGDLPSRQNFGVFRRLKSPGAFHRVRVSFDTIEWDCGVDLDPEFVYEKSTEIKGAQQIA